MERPSISRLQGALAVAVAAAWEDGFYLKLGYVTKANPLAEVYNPFDEPAVLQADESPTHC